MCCIFFSVRSCCIYKIIFWNQKQNAVSPKLYSAFDTRRRRRQRWRCTGFLNEHRNLYTLSLNFTSDLSYA